jgi:long-chain acyl-CoA synthetase
VELVQALGARHGAAAALLDPHASPPAELSFAALAADARAFAAGLRGGAACGDAVALFAENGCRYAVADLGAQTAGAAVAVRGAAAPAAELAHIVSDSNAVGVIAQDAAALARLAPALGGRPLRFAVVLWGPPPDAATAALLSCPAVATYDTVLARGRAALAARPADAAAALAAAAPRPGDVAALVYTSGTTGRPKGVRLTHANFLYQLENFDEFLAVRAGERCLSLLPPWHAYERTASLYVLSRGGALRYSNVRALRSDLAAARPEYLVAVPLVLETLRARVLAALRAAPGLRARFAAALLAAAVASVRARRVLAGVDLRFARAPPTLAQLLGAALLAAALAPAAVLASRLVAPRVRAALGVRRAVISGGGSLPPHLDDFYEAVGLEVLNGYGLSEASPVIACRSSAAARPGGNVRGSVGRPIPGTALRVVDAATGADVTAAGAQGRVLARGPGVAAGYLNNPVASAAAFSADGWLDTGDLGWICPKGVPRSRMAGCLVLTGRAKDTIVLSSGENVEPGPIEDALRGSPLVRHAVVVGEGRRALGALVAPEPEALAGLAPEAARAAVEAAVRAAARARGGPRWEAVVAVELLPEALSVEAGTLTSTMKARRAEVLKQYPEQLAALEARLR